MKYTSYCILAFVLSFLVSCDPSSIQSSVTGSVVGDTHKVFIQPPTVSNHQEPTLDDLEIPRTSPDEIVIHYQGFSISYNETHEQANWVAYELTKEETVKKFERKDNFRSDSQVKTGTASSADYRKSGYDRGHLAPAADMVWSEDAMSDSFFYSNMSPQAPAFNRGGWKKLEGKVREWAKENDAIYVVTGPVLSDGLAQIGGNGVSIPKYYYKVILDYQKPEIKAIGFLMPNEKLTKPTASYVVPIDKVEEVTGIDFFYLLDDKLEDELESKADVSQWKF